MEKALNTTVSVSPGGLRKWTGRRKHASLKIRREAAAHELFVRSTMQLYNSICFSVQNSTLCDERAHIATVRGVTSSGGGGKWR